MNASPRDTALSRMHTVHVAFCDSTPEPGLAASVALYIQAHVGVATSDLGIQQIYRQKLNPEEWYTNSLVCYPSNRNLKAAEKAWHAMPCDDSHDVVAKLVRKGGPAPTSVRYVGGLMSRCISGNKQTQKTLRDMIGSHYLGGYRHSMIVPDPQMHIALLTMTAKQLLSYATSTSSTRQLHSIVSEFVCANTLEHSALTWSVGPMAANHIYNVARGTLRAFGRNTPPARASPCSTIITLSKALNTSNMVPDSQHSSDVARIAVATVSPASVMKKYRIGTSAEYHALVECTQNSRHSSLKSMRAQLKQLSRGTKQFAAAFVANALQNLRLVVHTTSKNVKDMQIQAMAFNNRGSSQFVKFCAKCCTLRTNVGGAGITRTRGGVSVDIDSDILYCNNCKSTDIHHISMPGRMVTIRHRAVVRGNHIGPIAICCMCADVVVVHRVVGEYPMCKGCSKTAISDIYKPSNCFCGSPCTNENLHCEVIHGSGSVMLKWFCTQHTGLCPDRIIREQDYNTLIS